MSALVIVHECRLKVTTMMHGKMTNYRDVLNESILDFFETNNNINVYSKQNNNINVR